MNKIGCILLLVMSWFLNTLNADDHPTNPWECEDNAPWDPSDSIPELPYKE